MEDKLSGVFEFENGPIAFYKDGFRYTLLDSDINRKKDKPIIKDELLFGKTYYNHKIAIPIGKSFESFVGQSFTNSSYILSGTNTKDVDIDKYISISFSGGTLNSLYHSDEISRYFVDENDFDIKKTIRKYQFKYNEMECSMQLYAYVAASFSMDSKKERAEVCLQLFFPEPQKLITVYDHINMVKELISIMSFRDNVDFDRITVNHDESYNNSEVFIRKKNEPTNRKWHNNIRFEDIDKCIPNILNLIFNKKNNKASYNFGFIPEDDEDAKYMDYDDIKSICSALDCEMEFFKKFEEKDKRLAELQERVKETVKEHKKSSDPLDDKTYVNIYNYIDKWSISESERILCFYNEYKDVLDSIPLHEVTIDEKAIGEFIKYRNGITHGRYMKPNDVPYCVAETMQELVYVSFLDRMGLEKEKIEEILMNFFVVYS